MNYNLFEGTRLLGYAFGFHSPHVLVKYLRGTMVSSVCRIAMIPQLRPRPPYKWHIWVFVPRNPQPSFPVFNFFRPMVASQSVQRWSRQPTSLKFPGTILSRPHAKKAIASPKLCSGEISSNRTGNCSVESRSRARSLSGTAQPDIIADPVVSGPSLAIAEADFNGEIFVEKLNLEGDAASGVIRGEQESCEVERGDDGGSESERASVTASGSGTGRTATGRTRGTSSATRQRKRQADEKALLEWYRSLLDGCKKPATRDLIRNLDFSNLLGINESYRNGR